MREHQGFTLIELLIVILIIGIIASVATLSININQTKRLEAIANQLTNILTLAEQEAMLRPATLGFAIHTNSYRFYEYRPDIKNNWLLLNKGIFSPHPIPKDIKLTLKMNDESVSDLLPKLIISPSGDITPFIILIGKRNSTPLFKVTGSPSGDIHSERIDEEK
jgi:general secretion pathway protein H